MTMFRAVTIATCLASRVAAADDGPPDPTPLVEPDAPDHTGLPDNALHLEGGFGVDFGDVHAGNVYENAGLHGFVGMRRSRIALLGELDLAIVNGRDYSAFGGYGRAALESRLSLWQGSVFEKRRRAASGSLVRADLWIEPGIGYEDVSQAEGPALWRPDVSFTLGYQQTRHDRTGWDGTYIGLRVFAAEAPRGGGGNDLGVMLTSGITLGSR